MPVVLCGDGARGYEASQGADVAQNKWALCFCSAVGALLLPANSKMQLKLNLRRGSDISRSKGVLVLPLDR